MQLRIWSAALIYIGSYFPLSLILLVQDFDRHFLSKPLCTSVSVFRDCSLPLKNPILASLFVVICFICLMGTLFILNRTGQKNPIDIKQERHVTADLMNYILPYVVSFMSLNYQEVDKFIGFIIFLVWLFWITYKSGYIILNPALAVFGWKMYDVVYTYNGGNNKEFQGVALAKMESLADAKVNVSAIGDILIITDREN